METRRLVRMLASAVLIMPIVRAAGQSTPSPSVRADTTLLNSVIVTGSRLPRPDSSTSATITVHNARTLREAGITSVGDFLASAPYIAGKGFSAATNVNGRGTSSINLRGLDPARTLVLVNGRRMVTTNNLQASLAVDLNNIPVALVDRIEVLRGGASSAYGSDAVAGVVNIILRDHLDGGIVSAQTGASTAGDGAASDVSLTWGRHFGTGDIIASAGYFDRKEVYAGDRSLFRDFLVETGNPPSIVPGGSGNTGNPRADGLIIPAQGAAARAFTLQDAFNTAPIAYLQIPQRRFTANVIGSYFLSDKTRAFVELGYVDRHSTQFLGAFPIVVGPNQLGGRLRQLIRQSPYNTFPNALTFGTFQRRTVEAGPRHFIQDSYMARAAAGLKGTIGKATEPWQWEASYVHGRTSVDETITARPNLGRLADALDPTKCSTAAAPPAGAPPCVNLFYPGSLRPVDLDWIMYTDNATFSTRQHVLSGFVSGNIARGKADPIRVAFGSELRREDADDNPDPITAAGLSGGSQRDSTDGGFTVAEVFAELRAPIAANLPLVRALTLELGARQSNVNVGGDRSALTYRTGLDWRLTHEVRARAAYATAFRSPNINELFLGKGRSFPAVADACGNLTSASDATVRANCAAQGVPLGMIPAFSFETPAAVGGNRDLDPETAGTWSAALDLTPVALRGFRLSLDWFDIKVKHPIGITSVATIYNECYARSNQTFCNLITRDPVNGQLVEVLTTYVNQSFIRTSGLDITLDERLGLSSTRELRISALATYLASYRDQALPSSAVRSHVGYLEPAGGGFPRWRGLFTTGYETRLARRPLDLSGTVRFIGALKSWRLRDAPTALNAAPRVPAYAYYDFSLGYDLRTLSLTAGLLNAFDKQAPYYTGAPDTNTDVETYDTVGRRLFIRLQRNF